VDGKIVGKIMEICKTSRKLMGKCKKTIGKSRRISGKLGIEWIDLLRNGAWWMGNIMGK